MKILSNGLNEKWKLVFDKSTEKDLGDMGEYEGKTKDDVIKDLQADMNHSRDQQDITDAKELLKKYKHKWVQESISRGTRFKPFSVEVEVRSARLASEIVDDVFRGKVRAVSTNVFHTKSRSIFIDLLLELDAQGVGIEDVVGMDWDELGSVLFS